MATFNELLPQEITSSQQLHKEPPIWKFEVTQNDEQKVICGIFSLVNGTCFRLVTRDSSLNVVVAGEYRKCFSLLNKFVILSKFDIIKEIFSIRGFEEDNLNKCYIIVDFVNILVISDLVEKSCTPNTKRSVVSLQILSKSGLAFNLSESAKCNDNGGFFVCKASVLQSRDKKPLTTFVCFKNLLSKYYSFFHERMVLTGSLQESSEEIDILFRKLKNLIWLRPMMKHFETSECIFIPPSFEIISITPSKSEVHSVTVSQVINGQPINSELISVEGLVTHKQFMTPLYSSETAEISPLLLNKNIGTPGHKTLTIYLQDMFDSEAKICIYFSCGNGVNAAQYTLGIIPGIRIRANWLQQKFSKNNSVYLSNTVFSSLEILNCPSATMVKSKDNPLSVRYFISQLSAIPSGSVVTLLATISFINKVQFKNICPSCQSDFVNGSCSYLGCHAIETGKLSTSSNFIVEDGSESANIYTNEVDHVKTLSYLTNSEWNAMIQIMESQDFSISHNDWDTCHNNEVKVGIMKIFKNPQIFRPVFITARLFPKKSAVENRITLFLLSIRNINTNLSTL